MQGGFKAVEDSRRVGDQNTSSFLATHRVMRVCDVFLFQSIRASAASGHGDVFD